MKNIKRRFEVQQDKRHMHSTFLNFAAAIKGQGFTDAMVRRWFNKLVDKDDYDLREKRDHLRYLYGLAKRSPGRPYSGANLTVGALSSQV